MPITTIWSQLGNSGADSDETGASHRIIIPITGPTLGQVRFTILSSAGSFPLTAGNCSVGIAANPTVDCSITGAFGSSTFQLVTFSGGSLSIPTGATTARSDWINLATGSGPLAFTIDYTGGGCNFTTPSVGSPCVWWHALSTTTYNSNASFGTNSGDVCIGVTLIETQAATGGATSSPGLLGLLGD